MALTTKIKHVDQLANGVLRFRRRFPKDVAKALGEGFLQVHIRNTTGLSFHREYQAILSDFDRIVTQTRERAAGIDKRSPVERWHEALLKAEGLIKETTGLEDDRAFAAGLIADGLTKQADADPLLVKALVNPTADAPEVTVQDAANLYSEDKGIAGNKDKLVRFERTLKRLKDTLGALDQMPLKSLKREHGRKLMKVLLGLKKSDGSPIAIGTAQRDAIIVSALVTHGLKEFDLSAEVANPFASLPWPAEETLAVAKKLPLPDKLVVAVEQRLKGGRTAELPVMWNILKGSGMRLGEVAGLVANDVVLTDTTPHVLVRPNSVRGLKTASSIRSVPLTGEALEAAKQVMEGLTDDAPLFPRYARPRGADAASAALMKAVRAETKDKKLTVHGLRHRVSDKLREAGAPEGVRHGFLGHSSEAIAESTYGSPKARLEEFAKWAVKAGL